MRVFIVAYLGFCLVSKILLAIVLLLSTYKLRGQPSLRYLPLNDQRWVKFLSKPREFWRLSRSALDYAALDYIDRACGLPTGLRYSLRGELRIATMVEAIVLWNEPNNLSHWNFHLDPCWRRYAEMVKLGSQAIRAVNPAVPVVLGGVSSCDCDFLRNMAGLGLMDHVDAVGVHGFPLDWNHWQIDEWPSRIAEAEQISGKPVWVLEVGASSFGAEQVQEFGFQRTLDLLAGRVERIHWYSLFDLPPSWPAETRHKEMEGSSYYRHYYLGLVRNDGTPKRAERLFPADGSIGLCQWSHFEDPRLEDAVRWMKDHGVRYLRTGLSWADAYRANATDWFDKMMAALEPFNVSLTLCFTPAHLGLEEHHTSPPRDNTQFADFARWAVERYAPAAAAIPMNDGEKGIAVL